MQLLLSLSALLAIASAIAIPNVQPDSAPDSANVLASRAVAFAEPHTSGKSIESVGGQLPGVNHQQGGGRELVNMNGPKKGDKETGPEGVEYEFDGVAWVPLVPQ